jgi:polysaccharide biosynthesis protein PslH
VSAVPLPVSLECAAARESSERLRCLWIGRYIPHPMNEGAKVYSAKLAGSLAQSGMFVRFLGFGDTSAAPASPALQWLSVPGARARDVQGLFHSLPLAAAVDATKPFVTLLERQLRERWDAIVFDSYATGWALDRCKQYRAASGNRTLLVHVSHNDETAVWQSMAQHMNGAALRRWLVRRNATKVQQLQRRLVASADLCTTITDEDAQAMGTLAEGTPQLTLTPGYDGPVSPPRLISTDTPRRVAIVGSFGWVVKRENLTRFVDHADPIFARSGIELVVAGEMPAELRRTLQAQCRATRFEGFVSDLASLFSQTRLAIVPELIGGGFKLKLLDYLFARVPVATMTAAAAGLPSNLRAYLLTADSIESLTDSILNNIDDVDGLNRRQSAAFAHADTLFRWPDRGTQLHDKILELRAQRLSGAVQT